ncbi:hypothetical protein PgNI_06542 [Pyricularia grisea]|uniref:Uncharacterized protein n=1 Tax=Pyricularia grisea TaxID=148305 RepID=A0A6P8B621_PYRGI|nr:hypothetical protein PgNI_06542 [Pyricularia grisea]TLD10700.1 hypothetical protein PgNI_06542 [Pyricularia grisea]
MSSLGLQPGSLLVLSVAATHTPTAPALRPAHLTGIFLPDARCMPAIASRTVVPVPAAKIYTAEAMRAANAATCPRATSTTCTKSHTAVPSRVAQSEP